MGVKEGDDIGSGIRSLHVARQSNSGRHFVVFSEAKDLHIDGQRLLHDSMDLARHIPSANDVAH